MFSISPYQGIAFSTELLPKIIGQLNKDLQMTGFDNLFATDLTIDELIHECVLFFEELLNENDARLYNLLYRIDVNQDKIYGSDGKPQFLLAKLVLQREFEKVVLRKLFS